MAAAQREYRIISADSHTVEPPDLWEKWLERKYLDTAPRLVDDGDGGDAWLYLGGKVPEPLGLVTCVGTRPEELKWTGKKYGVNIHPSCYQGKARLEILDIPVSIHLLLSAQQTKVSGSREAAVAIGASAFSNTMPLITELIFQGVFDRFPKLRMAAVETGVGWIPHFLEMTDDRYWRNRVWA